MATLYYRSVQINLEHYVADRSTSPTSDFGWTNRAVVLCADVLNCCFGSDGIAVGKREELKMACERWDEGTPSSFRPIFRKKGRKEKENDESGAEREAFPEIWHSHACHSEHQLLAFLGLLTKIIIGVQHYKLAQILLCIFDPRLPRVGGSRSMAVRNMEAKIKPTLRELCSIRLYNRWTPPGMFTALVGIAILIDLKTASTRKHFSIFSSELKEIMRVQQP
ncbi:hypothetical protein BDZ45DRAFT_753705 [Acephala macrosclerotiorum]|nr:hypothetical protein BDZ45DRAFT_753705 [Acephala macrosclerotiorum]